MTTNQNFWETAPGSGGGLYNAFDATGYSVNKLPDFVVKAAFDPGFGHYEVFGVVSTFRNRVYPCAVVGTTAGNTPTPEEPTVLDCPVNGSTTPSATAELSTIPARAAVSVAACVYLYSPRNCLLARK